MLVHSLILCVADKISVYLVSHQLESMSACRSPPLSMSEVIDFITNILRGIKHLSSYSSGFCQSTYLSHIRFQADRIRLRERSSSTESRQLVLIRQRKFWTRTVFRQTRCLTSKFARSTRNSYAVQPAHMYLLHTVDLLR
jgi:hypothetical protein